MKPIFLLLALRSLFQHARRNLSIGLTVAVGALAMLLGLVTTDGIIRQTITGFTGTLIEDVMVFPKSAVLIGGKDVLEDYQQIQNDLYELEGVDYVTKKVSFKGSAYSSSNAVTGVFMGMEPEGIRRKSNLQMIKGEYLTENDKMQLILSEKLAARLGVTVGDNISVLVNMPRGGTNANDFVVKGIFIVKTGLQFVDHLIYISLWDTQDLMGLTRNEVLSLGIYLKDVDQVDVYEKKVGELLRQKGYSSTAFSWKKVMQEMIAMYEFIKYVVVLFIFILLVIITISVINSIYMGISERTREIGLRLAIGALEREVLLQFLIEAVVLAALGGVIGIVLATGASIGLSRFMEVPFVFNPGVNLLSFVFSAGIGVLFGYFPARRAARLDPIEALRHE